MRKVQHDKKHRKRSVRTEGDDDDEVAQVGMWGNYCTVSPMNENNVEKEDDDEQQKANEVYTIYKPQAARSLTLSAPLFGPPRKFSM